MDEKEKIPLKQCDETEKQENDELHKKDMGELCRENTDITTGLVENKRERSFYGKKKNMKTYPR